MLGVLLLALEQALQSRKVKSQICINHMGLLALSTLLRRCSGGLTYMKSLQGLYNGAVDTWYPHPKGVSQIRRMSDKVNSLPIEQDKLAHWSTTVYGKFSSSTADTPCCTEFSN